MVGKITLNGYVSIRSQNVITGCTDVLSVGVERIKFNKSVYGSLI
jgi:hypothetical protein